MYIRMCECVCVRERRVACGLYMYIHVGIKCIKGMEHIKSKDVLKSQKIKKGLVYS